MFDVSFLSVLLAEARRCWRFLFYLRVLLSMQDDSSLRRGVVVGASSAVASVHQMWVPRHPAQGLFLGAGAVFPIYAKVLFRFRGRCV